MGEFEKPLISGVYQPCCYLTRGILRRLVDI